MTTTTGRPRPHPNPCISAAVGLALGLGLAGCTAGTVPVASRTSAASGSAAGTATATTPGATSTPGPERDLVVGGRHVHARCDGTGPAVVLVADYGRSMDDTGPYISNLAPHAQVCLYDRLGVGRSDSAPSTQTFESLADDLDRVISKLGLTRPLVVVGDGVGAPIALTWISRHEKDARAVVLVNAAPPGFMGPRGALARLLPPKDAGDLPLSNLQADLDRFNDPTTNRESLDPRSWDAYLRLPPASTPLYDLVAPLEPQWPASVDTKKVNTALQQAQSRLLGLSSASRLVTVAREADWPATIRSALESALQG
ncbi:alpha/beta fold hydrolase [Intrasporangium flavum]|uniref:alpha/beta fold hydrolase n=1 Tax=Intrasporangium flavum TaxID=1428657 RepID=UPI001A971608|nr:alpha/beta hydrolase [Intrasporangium flavum]